MSDSLIRDNRNFGSVKEFLEDVIAKDSELSVVSAYFTIYAYYALRGKLDDIKGMKFLFGEPTFADTDKIKKIVRDYKISDDSLKISHNERLSQRYIARKCHDWIKEKVEIRTIDKPDFLHGKMYYVENLNPNTNKVSADSITGSSNFTYRGLGFEESSNIELNLIVDSERQKKELKAWFDDIWENRIDGINVKNVKDDILDYLKTLYDENPPEFIYFKTLYEIFSNTNPEISLEENTNFTETKIWKTLFSFQRDSLKGIINRIEKYNGCILADSVGLGKTYTALAVIKYYQIVKRQPRALVICPKKLTNNWEQYQEKKIQRENPLYDEKDVFRYDVIWHTDMNRETGTSPDGIKFENFNWSDYDLVVIDESHNFKGKQREYEDGKMNRSKFLMKKILEEGRQTKVLLLSATPVNNSFMDLKHQIDFLTLNNQSALVNNGIKNINDTLIAAQRQFKQWSSPSSKDKSKKALMGQFNLDIFKLLDELTIAKSRKHIMNFYNGDGVGKFPERLTPVSKYPEIDTSHTFKSYHEIEKLLNSFRLAIFNPSHYVKKEFKDLYIEKALSLGAHDVSFDQDEREKSLIGMMKIGYLKRLESSIFSFKESMRRIVQSIDDEILLIEKFLENGTKAQIGNQIQESADDENSELDEEFDIGKKLKFDLAHLRLKKEKKSDQEDYLLDDLKADRDSLNQLLESAEEVLKNNNDNKLIVLKELITEKNNKPINKNNKKVIIFTAFADTAQYLYENIAYWAKQELKIETALICGSKQECTGKWRDISKNKKDMFENILTDFAPRAKHRAGEFTEKEHYDILIATDCISEGQNLQDCDYLVNYDIHWNPVRIIQRFGRIDRIGSDKCGVDKIQMVNFWPTKELDSYINLETRVKTRAVLADIAATSEDNVLDENKQKVIEKKGVESNLAYRDNQLKRLQTEVLDMEDLDGNILLSDFSFDGFKMELNDYLNDKNEGNKRKMNLEDSSNGLYAIVSSCPEKNLEPGVIFCLKRNQKQLSQIKDGSDKINVIEPYYLSYIKSDGTVIYGYENPKFVLDVLRNLCIGKIDPFYELCNKYNLETNYGLKIEKYSKLLVSAFEKISIVYKKQAAENLVTGGRGAKIVAKEKQSSTLNDFELVTWLIIK